LTVIEADSGDLSGVEIRAALVGRHAEVLTNDAIAFLAVLHRRFDSQRQRLLKLREGRQRRLDSGEVPQFAQETIHIRDGSWTVESVPSVLRAARSVRVGPAERRALIEGLNGEQDVYIADIAPMAAPDWNGILDAHLNLQDRWRDALDVTDVQTGRGLRLCDSPAVLMVQPRAWHQDSIHLRIDGQPMSASLFDFGLHAFHCASAAVSAGSVCCLSLPMIESHQEARLWDDVLAFGQEHLGLQPGSVRSLAVIETLTAAFDADEILHDMRESAIGLTVNHMGLWAAYARQLAEHGDRVLPDLDLLAVDQGFSVAIAASVADICHRRNAIALGLETWGLAAQGAGVSGSAATDAARQDSAMRADAMLVPPDGSVSETGLRNLIKTGLGFVEAALCSESRVAADARACTPVEAELAIALLWQQHRHRIVLEDGRTADSELVSVLIDDALFELKKALGPDVFAKRRFADAERVLRKLVFAEKWNGFLTDTLAANRV
jgi:malate synthase